jgi:hypothetical protein
MTGWQETEEDSPTVNPPTGAPSEDAGNSAFQMLAGVHGSRTHPGRVHRPTSVLKTERPTGAHPLPRLTAASQALAYEARA